MAKIRVAIIGAGAAGLSMCKALVNEQHMIQCVIFEKSDTFGGTWVYTEDRKQNESIISNHNTPMYKSLRTNLPKEIMAFQKFPFPKGPPSYVGHDVVLKYLEDYIDHFGLRKYIKFQQEVVSVKPCENIEQLTWQVVTRDTDTRNGGIEQISIFDAVVVCNGHFSDLRIPEVKGMEHFPGSVMHSYFYSEPDRFTDKIVVILGAKSSGLDLCVEISSVAKKVYLVHFGEKIAAVFSENVEEILGTLTHGFADGSVEINNERKLNVDCVIWCTGYNYSFPFLTPECKIKVTNNRVTSLYKHVFSTTYPSLAFIGLCTILCPFPNFGLQSEWVASILTGRKVLPSRKEMVKDEEMDYQDRLKSDVPARQMHSLGTQRLKQYNDLIAELAGVPALPPVEFSLYTRNSSYRAANLLTYRNVNYSITENEWFLIE